MIIFFQRRPSYRVDCNINSGYGNGLKSFAFVHIQYKLFHVALQPRVLTVVVEVYEIKYRLVVFYTCCLSI